MQTGQSWAGALYYLLSTTLCTAALFLLADALEPAPPAGSAGQPVPVVHGSRLAGALFLVAALAAIGLPPLSGFIGKVMVMRSAPLPAAAVLSAGCSAIQPGAADCREPYRHAPALAPAPGTRSRAPRCCTIGSRRMAGSWVVAPSCWPAASRWSCSRSR
ncbi:proton-conducting transporter transmembrane domain-containing protein [Cupriavidus basilensis]